jgi:cyclomaltodextrinase
VVENVRVLYQIHSLGATGAPAANPDVDAVDPCGRGLQSLGRWVDHVAALGCGGVLLTPVFVSSTHGYDTVDPFRIDQRLGDDDDFDAFVAECHRRDLRVILDGVFNHVGRDFPPFRDVRTHGRDSAYTDWFRLDFTRDDGDGFAYRTFEGHRELVGLNHRSDAVLEWATAVARHWLARGTDGWRLDAAYAIPAAFLVSLTRNIRDTYPDAFVFGEVIHGDYAKFVTDTGLDAVTQYELYKAIWSALNDANPFELAWALERHRSYATAFTPVTFAGNHDVTRIASQLHDPRHLAQAVAILFTVPGMPCVYYGDEFAWRGEKEHRAGGDDAIRPPLPLSAVPVDEEQRWALDVHRQFIALRRDRPWLTTANLDVIELDNHHLVYRVSAGDNVLLVALDVDGAAIAPPTGWKSIATHPGISVFSP